MMKRKTWTAAAIIVLLAASAGSWAADDAEATIRLMGNAEAELPDAVTREITLPEHLLAADPEDRVAAVEKAENGLNKANERNANAEMTGQEKAAEARERSADMKEKAKENQENRGRSEDQPTPPETPPGRN